MKIKKRFGARIYPVGAPALISRAPDDWSLRGTVIDLPVAKEFYENPFGDYITGEPVS